MGMSCSSMDSRRRQTSTLIQTWFHLDTNAIFPSPILPFYLPSSDSVSAICDVCRFFLWRNNARMHEGGQKVLGQKAYSQLDRITFARSTTSKPVQRFRKGGLDWSCPIVQWACRAKCASVEDALQYVICVILRLPLQCRQTFRPDKAGLALRPPKVALPSSPRSWYTTSTTRNSRKKMLVPLYTCSGSSPTLGSTTIPPRSLQAPVNNVQIVLNVFERTQSWLHIH